MITQKKTIREWRAYHKMSKNEVALKLEIHPSTYAAWEDNPLNIRLSNLIRLSQVFNCDPEQIIFFENRPSFNLGCLDDNLVGLS